MNRPKNIGDFIMTDENKIEIREEHKCFCQSKGFRKFLVVAGGTFVGVFCALSLFAALHKPPMMPCPFGHAPMMRPPMHCHHCFNHHRGIKGDFHKKFQQEKFVKKIPVKVEVED